MKPQLMISDGRSQSQRQLPALNGDYFQLDEMRFEQILAIASEYARLVRFYQLDLSVDGDWQQFFGADESILMAGILAIETGKLSRRFEQRIREQPQYRDWFGTDLVKNLDASYRDAIDSPLLLVRLLNQWLIGLSVQQSEVALEVKRLLEGILRGLKWEIRTLYFAIPQTQRAFVTALCSKSFKDLVEWSATEEAASTQKLNSNEEQGGTHSEIRHNFHAFNLALRMLQNGVQKLLPTSMRSGKHDPATSLLIGFVHLYQQLQIRLNRFGNKHIDFYYHQVLGMQLQPQRIDSAYLVIKPNPATRLITIVKGAEFIAGIDENQNDIIYSADETTQLNNARVSSLHSIYFEKKIEKSEGEKKLLKTHSSYYRPIAVPAPDCEAGDYQKIPPLPLLGAPKPGEHLAGGHATRFGFAIASHTLLMQEGDRSIHLRFQFRRNAKYTIDGTLKEIAEQLQMQHKHEHQHEPQKASAVRLSDIFVKLMRSMFRISITTQNGWYVVSEYLPEYRELNADLPENCLAMHITLPAGAPAITAYHEKLHEESLQTAVPIIRFEMTQNEYAYPYDILTHWLLEEIELEVEVNACRQLVLHNQIGQVSALAPFMPFGPLPDLSSYLIVGCEEILGKQLRDVSLDVEWAGLPRTGGFSSYYRNYPTPLKAVEVSVKLAVLADGKWNKAPVGVPLFRHETLADGSVTNQIDIENRISLKNIVPLYKPTRPAQLPKPGTHLTYTSATMNGLFKLSLDSPEGAFGHQEYPQLLTRVLTHNAQTKKIGMTQALPNPPYTPQIARIVLNYRAAAKIDFNQTQSDNLELHREQFLHLHPRGWETMRANESKQISLIPVYPAAGNLMIGLQAEQLGGPLSLYFYLREDSLPMTNEVTKTQRTGLSWWYLASNKWKRLRQSQILSDSTYQFMTSGIVQLQLPGEINRDNTIMPSDQFWIGVTADHGIERFCSLYTVFAQAIKVSWSPLHGMKSAPTLPALSLNKSRSPIVGIDGIVQVRASFNGKATETRQQFRTRVSERLLHKNRALTAADYERLILEQFPQVFKVKCFSHLCSAHDPHARVRPGHLLIVPIPYLNDSVHANQKPTLSGHLIHEIQLYIQQFSSADVVISVENPVYEEIQVRCTIKLKAMAAANNGYGLTSEQTGGRYIEQINQAICDYLSPWNEHGLHQHFGWTIQQHNIISFLHDLQYIDEVTGVSLLQISPYGDINDLRFELTHNAQAHRNEKNLTPRYPWSIAVPMNEHWIVITDQFVQKSARAIGINELKVGTTFIIPSRNET